MRDAFQQVVGPEERFSGACTYSLRSFSPSAVLAAGVDLPSALAQRASGYKPHNGKYVRTVSQHRALMSLLAHVLIAVLLVVSLPVVMANARNDNRMLIPTDFSLYRAMCGGCSRAVPPSFFCPAVNKC